MLRSRVATMAGGWKAHMAAGRIAGPSFAPTLCGTTIRWRMRSRSTSSCTATRDPHPAGRLERRKGHGIGLSERGFIQPFGGRLVSFRRRDIRLPPLPRAWKTCPRQQRPGFSFQFLPKKIGGSEKKPAGITVSWLITDPHDKTDLPLMRCNGKRFTAAGQL